MAVNLSTLDKLHRIETFYRQGFQSELIDRALDKLLEPLTTPPNCQLIHSLSPHFP